MAILDFDEVYNISTTCLKLNVAHPDVPKDGKWARKLIFLHGIFTLVFSTVTYSLVVVDVREGFLKMICFDIICIVIWVAVTAQYGVLLWFRDDLKTLKRRTQEYFDLADSLAAEDQAVVIKYAERGRWVSKVWLYSACLNSSIFPVKSLFLTLYSCYTGEFKLVPCYDYSYPPPINEIKNRPEVFPFMFSCHVLFGIYATIMYIGFSPLGAIFILNACAQLELMKKEIRTVFTETPYNFSGVSRKIAQIVKKLQKIYSYVEIINGVFEVLYELNLKASTTMIPVTFYEFIDSTKRGELAMEYMAFLFTATLFCYVPCYYSDLLMEKGEELRLAIYDSGWESQFDPDARRSLLIMLAMGLRPISIRTIFRTICLDAFAELCHQAYALFSVLNAMWS